VRSAGSRMDGTTRERVLLGQREVSERGGEERPKECSRYTEGSEAGGGEGWDGGGGVRERWGHGRVSTALVSG